MYFPSTHWSLLAKASLNGESGARDAMEELCRRYWTPIYQFLRAQGHSEIESQDLTQAFLLHLLERSVLKKPDRLKGRFRSFLLGSLTHFLRDHLDRQRAEKRGGNQPHASLEEAEFQHQASIPHEDPLCSGRFDREWAMVILESALAKVQEEYLGDGRSKAYDVLRQFLPGAVYSIPYIDAAATLRMGVPAFKSEVHRMRTRFRAFVREQIAGTVSAPHEIEDEMHYLHQVLMDPGYEASFDPKSSAATKHQPKP